MTTNATAHMASRWLLAAIVPVIVEAVEPLLADFEDANRVLAAKAAKISGAAEVITQIGHGSHPPYSRLPRPVSIRAAPKKDVETPAAIPVSITYSGFKVRANP